MRKRKKGNLSPERMKIAKERITILLKMAEKELEMPERSRRYVELARTIGKRCNVRLAKGQKRKFCKKCNQLLIPKKTSEVRVDPQKKLIEIKCMNCGMVYKHPC